MIYLQKNLDKLDCFQQQHRILAFTYAVIKRYGEERVGYQAALLTYYAFLSLFPLFLVLATLTQLIVTDNPQLQANILHGVTDYFPVLGDQLYAHVHSLHKSGLALLVGIAIIFYGARGVADVFRYGVKQIWQIHDNEQQNFIQSALKSLKIIIVGGAGFIGASISAGVAAAAGHERAFRMLSLGINAFILFWLFVYLLRLCLPRTIAARDIRFGAAASATGLVILQLIGSYLLIHVLKNLDALYSYFATTLGLMFWIYLQSQVVYYAIEIAAVKNYRLWPRSLTGRQLTVADKQIKASS